MASAEKLKMFSGSNRLDIEKEINTWLGTQPSSIIIKRTETSISSNGPGKGIVIVISVWYTGA